MHPEAELAPLLDEVRADAATDVLDAWTWSTVVDEHVGGPVLDEDVVAALHAVADVPYRYPVGNAGLLHVYGYWLSAVATPFGRKRDRWVDGDLAAAFGLPRDAFHLGGERTLLRRVTDAALPVLRDSASRAPRAEARVGGLRQVAVAHRTGSGPTALVSGVDDGTGLRLLTIFPVAGDGHALLDELASGTRLRWNAAPAPQP